MDVVGVAEVMEAAALVDPAEMSSCWASSILSDMVEVAPGL